MTRTTTLHPMARTTAAIVTMFLPLAAVLGSFLLWEDRLPPELASHWSGMGPADGVMSVPQYLTLALVLTGVGAAAGVILGTWPHLRAASRRNGFLIAGIVAGVGAQTWLVSASLTMRAGDPYEVVLGAWSVLGFAAAGYGLVPFFLAPREPAPASHDVAERIDLGPGEGGAFSRTITAHLFLRVTAGLLALWITVFAISATAGELGEGVLGLVVIAAVAVVTAAFSRYRVTIDWRGLRVVSSVFRIPLKRIELAQIETVEAGELLPGEWGGWGYRVSAGRSALILRKGPGLILTLTSGTQFALTLDDPDVPVALLATLRDRDRAQAN